MKQKTLSILRFILVAFILFSQAVQSQGNVLAAANLSISPLTWNITGLDSNNVNVGPNNFPVGARVCNTGDQPATNVSSAFTWDSSDAYINLRAGTLSNFTGSNAIASLAPGSCTDFYYEVQITRDANAYDHVRRYHLSATATGLGSISTPTPREIFVEHLVSQNRNAVSNVQLDGVSIPAGGSMNLMVGQTYTIKLVGSTATQGYEQIESFINFPNTIFQVLSVDTTYSAESSPTLVPPYDKLYGDACVWENDPNSPNYRACSDIGKAGGNITVTYQVKILDTGSSGTQTLSTLIYDFSGSSYHYNSDYSTSARYVSITDPSDTQMTKAFLPNSIAPGGTSTLAVTITNPTASAVSGVQFTDPLPTAPGNMVVANPANASASGCGSPTFVPVPGAGSISFSNGTIAAGTSCTVKVNVTAPNAGTYTNSTGNLFINNTVDTGNNASASLTATTITQTCSSETMARWTVPASSTNPPDTAGGVPIVKASNVASAVAAAKTPADTGIVTSSGFNDTYAWGSWGYKNAAQYLNFVLDTSKYTNISMSFHARADSNGPTTMIVNYNKGSGLTEIGRYTAATTPSFGTAWTQYTIDFTGNTSTTGTTTFQITGLGALNDQSGANLFIDYVTFTGTRCQTAATAPTVSKSFFPDPISLNGTTTLTFTIANMNASNVALTNVTVSDDLPTGLEVDSPANASTTCPGATFAPTAGSTSLSMTLPTMSQNATCTAQVNVTATTPGYRENVSSYISSTESGPNKTINGFATDSLLVIAPPSLAKSFSPNPIQTGTTSELTFTIANPNASTTLTGVSFTDTLPPGLSVDNATTTQCNGTLTTTAPDTISLAGGSLTGGSTCTFSVSVTGTTAGTKDNTTGLISSAEGGTGKSASATLTVQDPAPGISLLKQVSTTNLGPWTSFAAVSAGDDVYYRLTVENVGDVPLDLVSVVDDRGLDLSGCAWTDPLPVALAGNDDHITSCVLGPVTAVAGSTTNTATVTADFAGTAVTDISSASYATSALIVTKDVSPTYFTAAGETLTYSYVVRNSGSAPLLGPVSLFDDKVTGESCADVNTVGDQDNYLDPGEEVTCGADAYTVQAADVSAGFVTNTAYTSVAGTDSSPVSKTANLAAMVIDKDAETANVNANGTITYSIVVKNTGQEELTNFQVSDPLPFAAGTYSVTSLSVTVDAGSITKNSGYDGASDSNLLAGTETFLAGATATITVELQLNNATGGTYDNTATATSSQLTVDDDGTLTDDPGTPGDGTDPETDEDVAVNSVGSLIIILDSVPNDPQDFDYTGAGVTSFILDDDADPTNPNTLTFNNLASGSTYTVTQTPVSGWGLTNIVCTGATDTTVTIGASGSFDPGDSGLSVVLASGETITCTFTNTQQSLILVKSGTESSFTSAGDVLHYSYLITNNGNTALAGPVTVDDDKSTDENCPVVSTVGNNDSSLDPGESITCTATYTITAGDVTTGSVTNIASATAAGVTSNTDSITVNASSGIEIVKSASATAINSGGSVRYTYTVTNTGGTPLTLVSVSDDKCSPLTYQSGDTNGNSALESAETWVYECTTTLTATTTNVGTVTAKNPSDGTVQDTDTATVNVLSSGMTKTLQNTSESFTSGSTVAIGEILTYQITIPLPADTAFTNVKVTDSMDKGLAFVDCLRVEVAGEDQTATLCPPTVSSITDPGDASSNPANAGRKVEFSIGDIPAQEGDSALVIQYRAVVLDVIENQDGVALSNNVVWTWGDGSLSAGAPEVQIVEPELSIEKSAAPMTAHAGQTITYALSIRHTGDSHTDAHDVIVTDVLPAGLSYVACSLSYSGLTPDADKRPADPCSLGSRTLSFGWDSFPLDQAATITFKAILSSAQQNVVNTAAVAWTSLPLDPVGGVPVQRSSYNTSSTERAYDPNDPVDTYSVSDNVTVGFGQTLPDTGFAPDTITPLSTQPLDKRYISTNLWLEIPSLGVKADIVGVPYVDGKWDVSWLSNQVGWLNGSAFPTWQGNSVLSAHVYLPNGKPGVFVDLSKLKWNDKIIIHAFGMNYIYAVQENKVVSPRDASVLKHEEKAWLTLLTCETFNAKTNSYENRVAVRAILASIEMEK